MKTHLKIFSFLLMVALGSVLTVRLSAQSLTVLHTFNPLLDGANPQAELIVDGSTIYGSTLNGGGVGGGMLFKIKTDGSGFTVVHGFVNESDGFGPNSPVLSSNVLFGTCNYGGNADSPGDGTLFRVNIDGTGYTNLHTFGALGGAEPLGGLIVSNNVLYGTTSYGGSYDHGAVFKINADGTDFEILHSFGIDATNNTSITEGKFPVAQLVLSGDTLYGATKVGGSMDSGTVFMLKTDGTDFKTLYTLTKGTDGETVENGLLLAEDTLYGTASYGGIWSNGTIFKLKLDGTNFTVLHSFTGGVDGSDPDSSLQLEGDILYGTTVSGGRWGYGTLYCLRTDGTDFTTLYSFTGGNDGGNPYAGLVLVDNSLYGTCYNGGDQQYGTLFSYVMPTAPPALTIIPFMGSVVLSWPTNPAGYVLQFTTNLLTPSWTSNSLPPSVANGVNMVTNAVADGQEYFRLSRSSRPQLRGRRPAKSL